MLKRIILLLISVLAVAGLVYWYFIFSRLKPEKAVAATVPLFVSVAELGALEANDQNVWLDQIPPESGRRSQKTLLNWMHVLMPDSSWRQYPGVLGWQTSGGTVSSVLVFDRKGGHQALQKKVEALTALTATFRNYKIYTLQQDSLPSVAIGIYHNLIILANLPLLVEEALDQLDRPDPDSRQWLKGDVAAKPGEVLLYLRTAYLGQLYKESLSAAGLRQIEHWRKVFDHLKIKITADSVWQGQLLPNATNRFWAGMTKQGRLKPQHLLAAVPANAFYAFLFALDQPQAFLRAYDQELEAFFKPWVGTSGAFVLMSPVNGDPGTGMALVLEVADEGGLLKSFSELENRVGGLETYDYGMFQIRQVLDQQMLQEVLPGQEGNLSMVLLDKAAIFASNPTTLERLLDQVLVGNTLAGDPGIAIEMRDPVKLLLNTSKFRYLLGTWLTDSRILQGIEQLGIGDFDMGMAGQQVDFQGSWQMGEQEVVATETEVIWRTGLDAPAASQPYFLEGMDLIFIQDSSRQLNALDRSGHLLWSKKLDGWLLSAIQEVDHFLDGTKQALFNTNGSIYLLDKKGNAVGHFPIRLQVPALNGLAVVDFDGNGQYFLFLAGTNGQFYGFDKNGGAVSGWNAHPMIFDHPVYSLQHIQFNNQDYLLILDQSGKLVVLSKNGQERFPVMDLGQSPAGPPSFQVDQGENLPGMNRMVAADKKGQVLVLNPGGQSFKLALQVGKNQDVGFHFADIIGDKRKDYLVNSGAAVALYSYDENGFIKQFETTLPEAPDFCFPVPFVGSPKNLIGATDAQSGQIYLLQENGERCQGFPLAGTTPFTIIGGTGAPILLVGNRGEIYAYRLPSIALTPDS